jgi:hypothetical protein
VSFEFHGFKFGVAARTERDRGYLGKLSSEFLFTNEYLRVIRARIADAAKQLPTGAAGVVVIDTTIARFAEDEDFLDACVGELGFGCRDRGGSFNPTQHRCISAAIHYKRDPDWGAEATMLAVHNPYASQ